MPISPRESLITIIMLSSVLLSVIFASVILALKFKQYRSRPYLLSCCLLLLQSFGIGSTLLIAMLHGHVDAPFDTILRPFSLISGFITLFFFLAYIVELKRPGKLNLKTCLFSISPFIITTIILILVHPSPLHHPQEIVNGIKRPDVLLRLIILFFYLAYPIVALCQPYEWRQCLVSRKTVTVLHILSCLIIPAFIAGIMGGYFPAVVINFILAIAIDAIVVYIELKIRIPVSEPVRDNKSYQEQEETTVKVQFNDSFILSPEIWTNPDMTVAERVSIMGTNHTYLLKKIKELGYSNYSDMINSKRVEHVCKVLENGTNVNITNLMFEAGFRSRSTASREFKRIVGCTPSEFQKSVSDKKHHGQSDRDA